MHARIVPLSIAITILISLFLTFQRYVAASSPADLLRYAYAVPFDDGQVVIYLVDPKNPARQIDPFTFKMPSGYYLNNIEASPDGRKILLSFSSGVKYEEYDTRIVLINTQTKLTTNVADYTTYPTAPSLNPYGSWSPDSQYVTFWGRRDVDTGTGNTYQIGLFIYSLRTGAIINIRPDSDVIARHSYTFEYTWSPDSMRLAVAATQCKYRACHLIIEAYDLSSKSHIASNDLDKSLPSDFLNGPFICPLKWSPDHNYLAFVVACFDYPTAAYYQDLYLWDTRTSKIDVLTSYTNPLVQLTNAILVEYGGGVDFTWYDARTILLGIALAPVKGDINLDFNRAIIQSSSYDVLSKANALLGHYAAYSWALNPVSTDVAFRTQIMSPISSSQQFQNLNLQIAAFNGHSLTSRFQAPVGCDLQWSPDGSTLGYAYLNIGGTYVNYTLCDHPEGLVFVSDVTGQIQQVALPSKHSRLAGWVYVQA